MTVLFIFFETISQLYFLAAPVENETLSESFCCVMNLINSLGFLGQLSNRHGFSAEQTGKS